MCHPASISPLLALNYSPVPYAVIGPQTMDRPVVARPGWWVGIPELGLKKLTTWGVEAACICDGGGVLATELGVATCGRGTPLDLRCKPEALGQEEGTLGESTQSHIERREAY